MDPGRGSRDRDRDRDLDDTSTFRRRWDEPPQSPRPSSAWLDPRLLIQVLTIIVTVTAAWVTLGNRLDVLQEKLVSIQGQLPNREVLELRIKAIEEKVGTNRSDLEIEIMKLKKWQEDATRDLIRKGVM
jgi:hypothetical protein